MAAPRAMELHASSPKNFHISRRKFKQLKTQKTKHQTRSRTHLLDCALANRCAATGLVVRRLGHLVELGLVGENLLGRGNVGHLVNEVTSGKLKRAHNVCEASMTKRGVEKAKYGSTCTVLCTLYKRRLYERNITVISCGTLRIQYHMKIMSMNPQACSGRPFAYFGEKVSFVASESVSCVFLYGVTPM